jgi:hypothetical protein
MALVKPPNPSTTAHDNSTMTSAAPPLSISLVAVAIPIGLALGKLAFPYVEGWLNAWVVRQLKLRAEKNQRQGTRLAMMAKVEALIKDISSISAANFDTLALKNPKSNKDDPYKLASGNEQFNRAKNILKLLILAEIKKGFADTLKTSVEVIWANLPEHEKKLVLEKEIDSVEMGLVYSILGMFEETELFADDDTDSDTIVSDGDESSEADVSDSDNASNDTQLVLTRPSINVTVDTSSTGVSQNVSLIVVNSNPAIGKGNLDIAPMSKRDCTWNTATVHGGDDETE